jgi:hypothetical protein
MKALIQRSARGNERAYIFWSIVGERAPSLAFRYGENFAVHAGTSQISNCQKIRPNKRAQS